MEDFFPVLPKLKTADNENKLESLKRLGWDRRERKSLEQLYRSLDVASGVDANVSSIPDMWARPLLFEMALLNHEHVLHGRILAEWRGLLAMIAMKEVHQLNQFTALGVTTPTDGVEGDQRDFLRTLARLLPKASLSDDTTWAFLYVYLYKLKPIGMTSPTTLVATAADYQNRISSRDVRWFNGTHLLDPAAKNMLSESEKGLLGRWIDNLREQLDRHGLVGDRWNRISRLLGDFWSALGEPQDAGAVVTSTRSSFFEVERRSGVFAHLNRPAAAIFDERSHVELIPAGDRAEGTLKSARLLVFERSIAEQWHTAPQNVTVSGAHNLSAARKPEIKDALVWEKADFFMPKLAVILQKDAFPGAEHIIGGESLTRGTSDVTPILPINPKLLDYFPAKRLAESVHWEQAPDGLRIHLRLHLSGMDPKNSAGQLIELTKLYQPEDTIGLSDVPILEIWPNFTTPAWTAYFTCYSTDNATATFEAKPWTRNAPTENEIPQAFPRLRRYWQTDSFPEALECRASISDPQTRRATSQLVGLVLLRRPEQHLLRGEALRVGVDFGASSTTICEGTAPRNASPVRLENRKVAVTASGPSAQARLFELFVPNGRNEMPVLSIFHDFNTRAGGNVRPFLDGHAYLLQTAEFTLDDKDLVFDLKWSPKPEDTRRVAAFLGQLCLQTAAELVATKGATAARWAFSHPAAFEGERTLGFPAICEQVTSVVAALSGIDKTAPNVVASESLAAAYYFIDRLQAPTQYGAIFIDIGGSTSDIAIWQEGKLVWQTSVLLAGRNLLSNFIWHDPDFLEQFEVRDSEGLSGLKARSGNERTLFHARTEAILRYNSDQIFKQLPFHVGTESVQKLKRHLALGIGGLFFYVGMLLRYLIEKGQYERKTPSIYIGGNGARVLQWLDVDGDGRVVALCKSLFLRAAGWEGTESFDIHTSPDLKKEAAFGLISTALQDKEQDHRVGMFAGEAFVVAGDPTGAGVGKTARACDTLMTAEDFMRGVSVPDRLDKLAEFLSAFDGLAAAAGIAPDPNDAARLTAVLPPLQQAMSYRQRKDKNEVVIEPIFTMALRVFLELRLKP